MSNAEEIIARLIDEQKITGEEAVTLIKSCNLKIVTAQKTNSDLWQQLPEPIVSSPKPWTVTYSNQNSIQNDAYRNTNSYTESNLKM